MKAGLGDNETMGQGDMETGRPLARVRELVRGWADEARDHARLKAELEVWRMKRRGLLADETLTEGERAVELLVLECELWDRLEVLLKEEA